MRRLTDTEIQNLGADYLYGNTPTIKAFDISDECTIKPGGCESVILRYGIDPSGQQFVSINLVKDSRFKQVNPVLTLIVDLFDEQIKRKTSFESYRRSASKIGLGTIDLTKLIKDNVVITPPQLRLLLIEASSQKCTDERIKEIARMIVSHMKRGDSKTDPADISADAYISAFICIFAETVNSEYRHRLPLYLEPLTILCCRSNRSPLGTIDWSLRA
ncbi:MAG: hypothetical protein MRY49_01265 [Candidatus Pacebacteria bacterium]|nr:hypothetical protein [Candidatus Paceibacterota bacterium]